MRRLPALLFALVLVACEEPLVILGDLPGFMRITAGVAGRMGETADTLAWRTQLTRPAGLAVSDQGILYFGDQSNRIFRVSSNGKLAVLLESLECFDKSCLGRVQGVALTADGNHLLIADDMSDKVWRLNIEAKQLVAIAGTGVNAVSPDGTPAAQASLASPTGVAVLPDGRILIAERNANRVRAIGSDGVLRTIAGNGLLGQANDGAQAAAAPLALPTAIAVANDVLYIAETWTNTVRAVDLKTGAIRKIAGTGGAGFAGDGGPAANAALNTPWSLAVSGHHLFIADQQNHRIRSVNLQTGIIATFAGTGTDRFTGNGRSAGETSVAQPSGLAASPFGFLYISDWGHSVVWRTPVLALTGS